MLLLNVIVDLFHLNIIDPSSGFHQMKEAGILGILHKATQGTGFVDPEYDERYQRAHSVDLLWGAYHFGTGEDGTDQANHFLSVVNPQPGQIMVLDYEPNPTGVTMNQAQAEAFVERIREVTGRVPVLYAGRKMTLNPLTVPAGYAILPEQLEEIVLQRGLAIPRQTQAEREG